MATKLLTVNIQSHAHQQKKLMEEGHVDVRIPRVKAPPVGLVLELEDSVHPFYVIDGNLYEEIDTPQHEGLYLKVSRLIGEGSVPLSGTGYVYPHGDGRDHDFSRSYTDTQIGADFQSRANQMRVDEHDTFYVPSIGPVVSFAPPPIREGQKHDDTTKYYAQHGLNREVKHFGQWMTGDDAIRTFDFGASLFGLDRLHDAQRLADLRAEQYRDEPRNFDPEGRVKRLLEFSRHDDLKVATDFLCHDVLRHTLQMAIKSVPRDTLVLLFEARVAFQRIHGVDILRSPLTRSPLAIMARPSSETLLPSIEKLLNALTALDHKGRTTMHLTHWNDAFDFHGIRTPELKDITDDDLEALAGLAP